MTKPHLLPSGHPRIDHLEMKNITKLFPGVIANDKVNFDIKAGEVHALLGENGAGKSTLVKQLYGLYKPTQGQIFLNGELSPINNPTDAINLGIGMIHQHFMLVDSLTVTENVALGLKSGRGLLTDLATVKKRILEIEDSYGLHVDPDTPVWQLSVGEQQRVEIIKALYRGAALLILDEPTAVLTPQEVDDFFKTLQTMADSGHALIFITHKLDEVMAFTNRVTVLRDGKNSGEIATKDTNKVQLAHMMVGRELKLAPDRPKVKIGKPRLTISKIEAQSDRGTLALKEVSLEVRSGEILGLAGLSGNGQLELAEAITGLRAVNKGKIYVDNVEITNMKPANIISHGVSYIPEERNRDGMIKEFSVAENFILRENNKEPYAKNGFLNFKSIQKQANRLVENFAVKTPSIETPIKNLSGGNAQKVILAREIARGPKVLIAAQPTRGLDIGATEYVRESIVAQRAEGTATILMSEDLDEILALSDRVAIIFHGEIMGILDREEASLERIGLMIAGEVMNKRPKHI